MDTYTLATQVHPNKTQYNQVKLERVLQIVEPLRTLLPAQVNALESRFDEITERGDLIERSVEEMRRKVKILGEASKQNVPVAPVAPAIGPYKLLQRIDMAEKRANSASERAEMAEKECVRLSQIVSSMNERIEELSKRKPEPTTTNIAPDASINGIKKTIYSKVHGNAALNARLSAIETRLNSLNTAVNRAVDIASSARLQARASTVLSSVSKERRAVRGLEKRQEFDQWLDDKSFTSPEANTHQMRFKSGSTDEFALDLTQSPKSDHHQNPGIEALAASLHSLRAIARQLDSKMG